MRGRAFQLGRRGRRLPLLALLVLLLAGFVGALTAPRAVSAAMTTGDSTWSWLNPKPQGNGINDISCPTSRSCFVAAGGILPTPHGGRTGASHPTRRSAIVSVSCPSSLGCMAVSNTGFSILGTVDGGLSWVAQPTPIDWWFSGIRCPSNDVCYTMAQNPMTIRGGPPRIFLTSDGGNTWTERTGYFWSALSSLACPTTTTCYAAGQGGFVYRTTNSGLTWTQIDLGISDALGAMTCPAALSCYLRASGGAVMKTTDGWASWKNFDPKPPAG